jgi:hypothetical protein
LTRAGGMVGVALPLLGSPGLADAAASRPSVSARVQAIAVGRGGSPNTELTAVSCVRSTFCIAVGTYRPGAPFNNYQGEHPVVTKFDGHKWSNVPAPAPLNAELNGVDCLSRTSCVAVGEQIAADGSTSPLVEELKSSIWSVTRLSGPTIFMTNEIQLRGVSCMSVGDCIAVGWDRGVGYPRGVTPATGLIAQENSGGWTLQTLAPLVPTQVNSALGYVVVPSNAFDPTYLMSVSCTPGRCVAVGQGRAFVHAEGGWNPIAPTVVLNGVSCASASACTGVGQAGQGMAGPVVVSTSTSIARLSGTQWRRVPSPNTTSPSNVLNAVACWSARTCVAVGSVEGTPVLNPSVNRQGGALVEVQVGNRWVLARPLRTPERIDDTLASVSCPTQHVCVAVGQSVADALDVPSGPIRALSALITH